MTHKHPYIIEKDKDGNEWAIKNESYWKQKALEKFKILLKRSGIPEFYWNIEWKDYKGDLSKDNLEKCIKYANEFYTSKFNHVHLYLWSEMNGSQKTACACNIGKDAIRQGYKVKFVLAGTLIDMLMKNNGFNFNEETYKQLQEFKEQDILIIDDAFSPDKSLIWKSSTNNNIIISEWDRFLRELVSSNVKIIVTSNMTIDRIKELYSESLFELIDRNFVVMLFQDSIKKYKKKQFDKLWE